MLNLVSEGENAGIVPISPQNIPGPSYSDTYSLRSSDEYSLSHSLSASDRSLSSDQNIDPVINEMDEPNGNYFIKS